MQVGELGRNLIFESQRCRKFRRGVFAQNKFDHVAVSTQLIQFLLIHLLHLSICNVLVRQLQEEIVKICRKVEISHFGVCKIKVLRGDFGSIDVDLSSCFAFGGHVDFLVESECLQAQNCRLGRSQPSVVFELARKEFYTRLNVINEVRFRFDPGDDRK